MTTYFLDSSEEATTFDYGSSTPCQKMTIKTLGAKFLPPLYSFVFIVGLLGNLMVVLILTKYKRFKSMTNIYLFNLSISDLLFLFTLPFWIHYARQSDWVFGHTMCKILSGLYYMGLYSEIFFIVLLTIDRYLAVVYAVFAMKARRATFGIITSIITWCLSVLAAVPEFIFYESQNDMDMHICTPHYPIHNVDTWKRFHALRMNILGLAIPLAIMIICYTGIIKKLLNCRNDKKYKAVRLIFVIMIVFFLFWTPYNLTLLLSIFQASIFEGDCEKSNQLDVALQVTEVIAYTHCCVNPVIYAFVGERFRKYFCHFVRRHIVIHLCNYIPFLPGEKLERVSSISPSTGVQELSAAF
ncbi:C-C chemokine receptor type 3-like [Macrotis lagotis]|uniref:C-C chemokine receptor type 3-like n=1 Tax=Macrotis lagotis TaxID=92651 RepID=UPI003D680AB2